MFDPTLKCAEHVVFGVRLWAWRHNWLSEIVRAGAAEAMRHCRYHEEPQELFGFVLGVPVFKITELATVVASAVPHHCLMIVDAIPRVDARIEPAVIHDQLAATLAKRP